MSAEKNIHVNQIHNIPPVYDENSKILILGSFPSVRSRADQFYYAHPANRFWRVLSAVFNDPIPNSVIEKTGFLLNKGIALWDVIESCELVGSSDSSIKNVRVNDIAFILDRTAIERIYLNGATAKKYYDKYLKGKLNFDAVVLPSTSAANATFTLEKLTEAWSVIL